MFNFQDRYYNLSDFPERLLKSEDDDKDDDGDDNGDK